MALKQKFIENVEFINNYHKDHGTFRIKGSQFQYYRNWMTEIRMCRRKGKLSDDEINALNAIVFCWDPFEDMKKRSVDLLCRVLKESPEFFKKLGKEQTPDEATAHKFLYEKRRECLNGSLNPETKQRICELLPDFPDFVDKKRTWEESFNDFRLYSRKHNENLFKIDGTNTDPEYLRIAEWIHGQRKQMNSGKLTQWKIDKLNSAGMAWSIRDALYFERYNELMEFKGIHGHCRVSSRDPNKKLVASVAKWRKMRREGRLPQWKISMLTRAGFWWGKE